MSGTDRPSTSGTSGQGPRRALVLGGGGVSGIAWEAGALAGLLDEGIDARSADLVIGTSAGSIVGARFLGDPAFREFVAAQTSEDVAREDLLARELVGVLGSGCLRLGRRPPLGWLPGAWVSAAVLRAAILGAIRRGPSVQPGDPVADPDAPPNVLHAKIGRLARVAPCISERRWLEIVTDLLGPVRDWPERLRVTAVDAVDGRLVAFDARRGAPLSAAVAASTSVPALFPPVVIAGRPYIDGGITSETNCMLASGCEEILILAPLERPILAREVARLRDEGSRVTVVAPSEAGRRAVGSRVEVLDPIRRSQSARAGYEDGRAAAAALDGVWRQPGDPGDRVPGGPRRASAAADQAADPAA